MGMRRVGFHIGEIANRWIDDDAMCHIIVRYCHGYDNTGNSSEES